LPRRWRACVHGRASFERIRYRQHDGDVYAFDLIELNGDDLRRDPLEVRNVASLGLRFNESLPLRA
jgi:hypothetical protein